MSLESTLLFVRAPLGGLTTQITRDFGKAAQSFFAQFTRTAATPQTGIVSTISRFFTSVGQSAARARQAPKTTRAPFQQIPLTPAKTTIGISGKTLAGAGLVSGATVGTTLLFTQTEGGQQALKSAEKIAADLGNVGQNVTEFLSDNPIILPLALGIGLIVVLKS